MATKDWKKTSNRGWTNIKSNVHISLEGLHNEKVGISYPSHRTIIKSFKTKSQALKFARAYMRKH